MKLEDQIIASEMKIESVTSPILDIKNAEDNEQSIKLITLSPRDLFLKLVQGEELTYKDILEEKLDGDYYHGSFKFAKKKSYSHSDFQIINDLELRKYFYSYNLMAKDFLIKSREDEIYISLFNIHYQNTTVQSTGYAVAPLFFLPISIKCNDGVVSISSKSSTPIFNKSLLRKIKLGHDIDLSYGSYDFILNEYLSFINNKLNKSLFSIEFEPSISVLPLIEDLKLNYVVEHRNELSGTKIASLYLNEPYLETAVDLERVSGEYEFINKIHDSIYKQGVATAVTANQKLAKFFVTELSLDYISSGKTINIYGFDPELPPKWDSFYNRLDSKRNALMSLIEEAQSFKDINLEDYPTEVAAIDHFNEVYQSLLEAYDWKFEIEPRTFAEQMANYTAMGKPKYHFNIGDYNIEEMRLDLAFFQKFASLVSLNTIAFKDHPFYGLTSRADDMTFKSIHEAIETTLIDLDAFETKFKESEADSWGLKEINNLSDFKSLEQHLDLLISYHGDFTYISELKEKELDTDILINIKNAYSAKSSLKLSIDMIADPKVYDLDYPSLVSSLEGKGKAKKRAKNSLLEVLKIKDKSNYKSLLRLLGLYHESQEKIQESIKPLLTLGIEVSCLDDVVEIEAAIEYINEFERHAKLYNNIDFANNEFIHRYFNDPIYSDYLRSELIPELEELSNQLENDFDMLYSFFDSAEKKDYELMTFAEIRASLQRLNSASYSSYLDYYNFVISSKDVSLPLRDIINNLIESGSSFVNLEVNFFKSVFEAYRQKSEEEVKDEYAEYGLLLSEIQDHLAELGQAEQNRLFVRHMDEVTSYLNSQTYRNSTLQMKKAIMHSTSPLNDLLVSKYSDVVQKLYPLMTLNKPHYDKFDLNVDLSIVANAENFDIFDLLYIASHSKSVLFLERDEDVVFSLTERKPLKEIMPVHKISLAKILEGLEFNVLEDHLFNLLEYHANRLGFQLKREYTYKNEVYPLVLLRPGIDKPQLLLIPDLASELQQEELLKKIIAPIYQAFHIKAVVLPLFIASLNPRDLLMKLTAVKELALNQEEDDELRFEEKEEPLQEEEIAIKPSKEEKLRAYEERLEQIRSRFVIRKPYVFDLKKSNAENTSELLLCLPIPANVIKDLPPFFINELKKLISAKKVKVFDNMLFPYNSNLVELGRGVKTMKNISNYELKKAVYTYISSFSFLKKDVLLKELANIIEVSPTDHLLIERVDEILENYIKEHVITVEDDIIRFLSV